MIRSAGDNFSQPGNPTYRVRVRKANLTTFGSFYEGAMNMVNHPRMQQARQDWKITDSMKVCSFSYSLNSLRITFDSATLEIIANGPTVDWRIHNLCLPSLDPCANPCSLIFIDLEDEQEFFDRDTILIKTLGQHIRYAPSLEDLYLIWKPNQEIAIVSHPLAEGGYLLHYCEELYKGRQA